MLEKAPNSSNLATQVLAQRKIEKCENLRYLRTPLTYLRTPFLMTISPALFFYIMCIIIIIIIISGAPNVNFLKISVRKTISFEI